LSHRTPVDYRKLAIDIAEVIINWELKRIKETSHTEDSKLSESSGTKRTLQEVLHVKKLAVGEDSPQPGVSIQVEDVANKPIEYRYTANQS
jgi:hypothetical protein